MTHDAADTAADSTTNVSIGFSEAYQIGKLDAFFALGGQVKDSKQAALKLPRPIDRESLVRSLGCYAGQLNAPQAVHDNLHKLAHPNSRAVVTGQQVGLLLGPMFTLSKAVTAIKLARELDSEDTPVVPIFWLASQDHDSDEIDHTYILDADETLHKLQVPLPEAVPAGRIELAASWVENTCLELERLPADDTMRVHKDEVLALLQETAEDTDTFADWFARILYKLLGDEGLIIINPLEDCIASHFHGIIKQELDRPLTSSQAINQAGDDLAAMGYAPQLGRAADATNLFYEVDGGRHLLRYHDELFWYDGSDGDVSVTREALLENLHTRPSCITPAAGLRPITQDAALPTAITVVGPGELRYFAQLKGVYDLNEVAMPLIAPRMTVTLLEPPARRVVDKFGLDVDELYADFEGIRNHILLKLHGHAEVIEGVLQTLETSTDKLLQHIQSIDPTLEQPVERGAGRIEHTIEQLRDKSARALAQQDDIYANQLSRLQMHLLPLGNKQERLLSPFSYFLKFGIDNVISALLELPPEGHQVIRF